MKYIILLVKYIMQLYRKKKVIYMKFIKLFKMTLHQALLIN